VRLDVRGQAIEPPTGEALRDVLLGMHTIPADEKASRRRS
jgi:hypothetical protein